jgi:hypothetical protein
MIKPTPAQQKRESNMIYYKVKALAQGPTVRKFDDAESAIRAAMSHDHENVIFMCDSQDPTDQDVQFAYCCLNTIHLEAIASGDFVDAANRVAADWPYKVD